MRGFTPSPKQRNCIYAATINTNILKFATEDEKQRLQRALFWLRKNGLVYNTEVSTAIKVLARAKAARSEAVLPQSVSSYTKKDGTFVRSYVRNVNKNLK